MALHVLMKLMSLPILIIPHENIIVNREPGSADLWENSHHAVTLHICKALGLRKLNKNCLKETSGFICKHFSSIIRND